MKASDWSHPSPFSSVALAVNLIVSWPRHEQGGSDWEQLCPGPGSFPCSEEKQGLHLLVTFLEIPVEHSEIWIHSSSGSVLHNGSSSC